MPVEKKDSKICCCKNEKLAKLCKYCKFLPHNWFCLPVLHIIFAVLFYVIVIFACTEIYSVLKNTSLGYMPQAQSKEIIMNILINRVTMALVVVMFAQITKALFKIKLLLKHGCGCDDKKVNKK